MVCLFVAAIECHPGPRPGVVLLDFWATWCAPCRASGPALADLAGRFGSNDVAVVGISADEDEQAWRRYIGVHAVRRLEVHADISACTRSGGSRCATAVVKSPIALTYMADQPSCCWIVKVASVGSKQAGRYLAISCCAPGSPNCLLNRVKRRPVS